MNDKEIIKSIIAQKYSKFLIKHSTVDSNPWDLGKFEIGMYRKVDSNLKLAAKVKCDWIDKATEFEVGGDYTIDSNNSLKAKVNSSGKLDFAWRNALSKTINAVISAETTTDTLFSHSFQDIKFGFRLNISH